MTLSTDQKAGGSSPSERAQVTGSYPLCVGAFSVPSEPCWEPLQPIQGRIVPGSSTRRRPAGPLRPALPHTPKPSLGDGLRAEAISSPEQAEPYPRTPGAARARFARSFGQTPCRPEKPRGSRMVPDQGDALTSRHLMLPPGRWGAAGRGIGPYDQRGLASYRRGTGQDEREPGREWRSRCSSGPELSAAGEHAIVLVR